MKLKMAKNSLFAVLLRSPWWISIALTAAFCLASVALLPRAYVPFGMMGALPFLVIGIIAARRQWNVPSAERVADTLATFSSLSTRDFIQTLEAVYTRQGYTVQRLDHKAADLRLAKGGSTTLLACKRWKASNQGVEPLRELVLEKAAQRADRTVYVSLGPVTDKARQFAQAEGVQLLSDAALAQLLQATK